MEKSEVLTVPAKRFSLEPICLKVEAGLQEVLQKLDAGGKLGLPAGIVLVLNDDGSLMGTITDGDVRRALMTNKSLDIGARDIVNLDPVTFPEEYSITMIREELPVQLVKRHKSARAFSSKIPLLDKNRKPVRLIETHQLWEQKVATHRHLVVVGLGYVGLTMALALADVGYTVTGIDVDPKKLDMLRNGVSYVHEVGLEELLRETIGRNFKVSDTIPDDGDVFIISVGTPVIDNPITGKPEPILDYLRHAVNAIAGKLKQSSLVILRSTVPIGTCRTVVKEQLEEQSGLRCGMDFHLAFAPERTAEGKALKELRELPQLIGGFDSDSTEATVALFKELTSTIIRVDSLEAAEMAKLINNSFRDYVFAYSNQVAQIAGFYNINVNDVIRAANEGYPRDKVPFPSPGVGGPCLTKDPYIFASVAEKLDVNGDSFQHSRRINLSMHGHVKNQLLTLLKMAGKNPSEAKVLVCGLAFKGHPETGDLRNSTSIEILNLLRSDIGQIWGYDPVATPEEIREFDINPVELPDGFAGMDAVVFLNNHRSFEKIDVFSMTRSMAERPVIYDGWGLFRHDEILHTRPCLFSGLSFYRSSLEG